MALEKQISTVDTFSVRRRVSIRSRCRACVACWLREVGRHSDRGLPQPSAVSDKVSEYWVKDEARLAELKKASCSEVHLPTQFSSVFVIHG